MLKTKMDIRIQSLPRTLDKRESEVWLKLTMPSTALLPKLVLVVTSPVRLGDKVQATIDEKSGRGGRQR